MASDANLTAVGAAAPSDTGEKTVFKILLTISFCHLLNDTIQSLMPPVYPLLQRTFHFNYWQVGRIALTTQLTASILQPIVGFYTDRRPKPYSLAVGMGVTMIGLVAFAMAPSYGTILAAAALVGIGSAVFHPESSRIARLASGGQHGMAQSLFQVGGNAGSGLGVYQRTVEHCVVFALSFDRHSPAHQHRDMVSQSSHASSEADHL